MCNWILRAETEHSIRRQAETHRLGAKVDGTVGCDKEAACRQAEPRKRATRLSERTLGRRPRAQGRMSRIDGTTRQSCLHQKPCRSSRGERRQRTQHSGITRDAPITTRGTRKSHHRDLLNQQEEGCNSARRTRKPGTEGEPKRRIAVRPETVRVNIGYLRVVVELEPTTAPETLGLTIGS